MTASQDDETFALIELIYQIPHNPDAWQQFAKKIIHILDASYVHIQAIDFNYQVLSFSNGIGPLAAESYVLVELDYLHYPTEADPRWGKFLDSERTGWYQCHSHVSDEFVQQSDLYQNILLPYGLRYVATHELIWDEKLCVFWSISTSQQRQPLNQQELAFLDVLLPHLKRVVMAQRHLYEFSATNIVGYNLIDQLAQPIMLLNLSGNVVHFNPAMQDFLQNTDLIKVENQQLYLPQQSQIQFLKILYQIEVVFRQQHEQLQQYKELKFFIPDTGLFFTIHLLVSEKEQSFFGIRPLVMLKFEKIHQKIIEKYQLTKREIVICELFVKGLKLEEIAKTCEITIGSLRTYIKRIFVKTQTNSQVELMHLLMQNRGDHKQ